MLVRNPGPGPETMTTQQDIRDFAYLHHVTHGEQKYGDEPFIVHLDDVWGILQEYASCIGGETIMRATRLVAYTHDFLEDVTVLGMDGKDVTEDILAQELVSETLFKAVKFCTDEKGQNRKERKAKTYARCRADIDRDYLAFRQHQDLQSDLLKSGWEYAKVHLDGYPHPYVYFGVAAKLADRLANLRRATADKSGLLSMYRKEKDAFRDALYVPGMFEPMWAEYDRLLDDPYARKTT